MTHLVFFLLFSPPPDVAAMKAEVRALAKARCADVKQCRAVPLGARPCGGPTEFVVTCASDAAFASLEAKAKAASAAEQKLNEKEGRMGTCIALAPPTLKLEGGACTAAAAPRTDVPM